LKKLIMRKAAIENLIKYTVVILVAGLTSCRSGPINLFKAASPHQIYRQKLVNAGLDKTALGAEWINNADKSLRNALDIKIPYKETGYFAAERIPVSTYRFSATKGQKLKVTFNRIPAESFKLYLDIWEQPADKTDRLLASADTLGTPLELDIKTTGSYLIRLQPELLQSGQYTIEITAGPSLGFPVKSTGKSAVQSFFGDGRDANTRKHEGIDIFAPFRTPVVAIAEGSILRVNENNLGGKVVWMRPAGKDYTLYYAHLDEQIATEGQQVVPGDTLGLIGNTGNAKHTSPHLHFGIYTSTGAVDPYPFVNPVITPTQKITSALSFLNNTVRSVGKAGIYSSAEGGSKTLLKQLETGTVMDVYAANGSWYTVKLPDEELGFISAKQVVMIDKPLRKHRVTSTFQNVYDQPDSLAAVKFKLQAGKTVAVLGSFQDYYLIADEQQQQGWISQK
jgi:murein DD-endopeptidase MepM/ murein hydrolase activator NlpD